MENLALRNFDIDALLAFEDKYAVIKQDWRHTLKIAQFMSRKVRSSIERKCLKIKNYKDILEGRTILFQGEQLLTNTQIWKVIRLMIEPRSVRDVRKLLSVSVFPAGKYDQYKSTAETIKNFSDFKNQCPNFDRA